MSAPMGEPAADSLWPTAEQMKRYLDSWALYVGRLEDRTFKAERQLREAVENATLAESRLRAENRAIAGPLQAQIYELEDDNRRQRLAIAETAAKEEVIRRRLAAMLETNQGPGVTTETLLDEVALLVEESKRQLRRSL